MLTLNNIQCVCVAWFKHLPHRRRRGTSAKIPGVYRTCLTLIPGSTRLFTEAGQSVPGINMEPLNVAPQPETTRMLHTHTHTHTNTHTYTGLLGSRNNRCVDIGYVNCRHTNTYTHTKTHIDTHTLRLIPRITHTKTHTNRHTKTHTDPRTHTHTHTRVPTRA